MPSSKSSKPKPSEVAAETKRHFIPLIKRDYGALWPTNSYLWDISELDTTSAHSYISQRPHFWIVEGDPVDQALSWLESDGNRNIAFVSAANEKRPGGDWETGVLAYEERLCRRSNLSATLSTPACVNDGSSSMGVTHYPIPIEGGIWSPNVVIYREKHDRYEKRPPHEWRSLPICSVPPVRWPKLTQKGEKYSFADERDMVQNKMRAALAICIRNGCTRIVIGDWGLGNGYRNPPRELAELWRDTLLWAPGIRGQIEQVLFVFEDTSQNTARVIRDDLSKKSKHGSSSSGGGSSSSSKGKSKSSSSSSSSGGGSYSSSGSSASGSTQYTDFDIFNQTFDPGAIEAQFGHADPKYSFESIMSPM